MLGVYVMEGLIAFLMIVAGIAGVLLVGLAITVFEEEAACEREHNVYDCVRTYVPAEAVE
jgi:Tfp pilus assembly protein PilV